MIVGLSGKQRSGKDTYADHLIKQNKAIKVSFATPLKQIALMFGMTKDMPKGRQFLQELGAFGRKNMYQKFWADKGYEEAKRMESLHPDKVIFLTDVRYTWEADLLKKNGHLLYRIEAKKDQRILRGDVTSEYHISEVDLDDYPHFRGVFFNNGTLEEFTFQVDNWYNTIQW